MAWWIRGHEIVTSGVHTKPDHYDHNFAIRCYYCPGVGEPEHDVVWWSDIEEDYRSPDVRLDYRAALSSVAEHTGIPADALEAAITLAALTDDYVTGMTFFEGQGNQASVADDQSFP